jgi:hypothetical protein
MTAENLNFLVTDITELILERTNIDEVQEEELWEKIHKVLDEFFGYPEYSNYN